MKNVQAAGELFEEAIKLDATKNDAFRFLNAMLSEIDCDNSNNEFAQSLGDTCDDLVDQLTIVYNTGRK